MSDFYKPDPAVDDLIESLARYASHAEGISSHECRAVLREAYRRGRVAAPASLRPEEGWRSAVMLAGLTPEKVSELWQAAMFESVANFRGYLDKGMLPNFGKNGEATLPERFVIKLVQHLQFQPQSGS